MNPTRLLTFLLAGLLAGPAAAQTASPRLIPFQGRLTDQNGTAYTQGQYTLTFNIYSQAVGGTSAWTERHEKVGVVNGMVNVFLGSIQVLDAVDFSTTKYLGITIDADNNATTADPEMVPRQMIIPAFHAKNAEKLASNDWSTILEGGSNNPATTRIAANRIQINGITQNEISTSGVASDEIQDGSVARADLATDVLQAIVPAGSILPFGGSSVPAGWLLCDGSAYRSDDHPDLFAAIGGSWGNGSEAGLNASSPAVPGQTNFNVPDLRGYFLRGRDGGAGRDPNATLRNGTRLSGQAMNDSVGSLQLDGMRAHTHLMFKDIVENVYQAPSANSTIARGISTGPSYDMTAVAGSATVGRTASMNESQPGESNDETRPKNAYVNFIIKR